MARITPSALIDDIKGSLGGVTFSSWKGMTYVKAKAKSVRNPATEKQVVVRNAMTYFSRRYYDDLSEAQRAAWDQYAQEVGGAARSESVQGGFGLRVVPQRQWTRSGYNWYIAINVGLITVMGAAHYAAPIDDAPLGQTPPSQPTITSMVYDDVVGKFTYTLLGPQDLGHATSVYWRLWVLPNFAYAKIQNVAEMTTEAEVLGATDLAFLQIQRTALTVPLPDGIYAFQLDCVGRQNGLYSPPSEIVKVAAKFVGA